MIAYDACDSGYGAVQKKVDVELIKKMHCQSERNRFKAVNLVRFRPKIFVLSSIGMEDYLTEEDIVWANEKHAGLGLWASDPDFGEVPGFVLFGE